MVSKEDGEKKAKDLEIIFFEVSAKSGINVDTLFKNISQLLPPIESSQVLSTTHSNIFLSYNF